MPTVPTYSGDLPARTQTGETFDTNVNALLAWMVDDFAPALNDFSDEVVTEYAQANYNSTSTTSLAIGTGSKAFTIGTGKVYSAGQFVIAASAANVANFMSGQVVSYSGGVLTVDVDTTGGAGTFADWAISLSGPVGAEGPAGGAGTFVEVAGDTMTGPLVTAASDTSGAGFNLPAGTAPSSPSNGDLWATTAGFFARIGGVTLDLLGKVGGTMTGALSLTNASTIKDADGTERPIGFRNVPLDIQAGTVTLDLTHEGGGLLSTNTGAVDVNIPANATTAYPVGTVILLDNSGTTALTVKPAGGVTLTWAVNGSTGNRTLAASGMATLLKNGTDSWKISGAGLS